MLIRAISGAVYCGIITGFFFLREIDVRLFQFLPLIFCLIGTFEIARAFKSRLMKGWYILSIVYGALFVCQYAVSNYFLSKGLGYVYSLSFAFLMVIITLIACLIKKTGFKKFLLNVLPFVYPSLLILSMCISSDIGESNFGLIALLLIFVIPAISDTFAYLIGMIYNKIRKGKAKKLCPFLSPKKTVAGAIGGVIGGVVASLIIYAFFKKELIIWLFIYVGIFASILTEIGDLFESYIKRKVGIKDMGKIMPGHGGVMDRIDGMSFASLFICITFILL